MNALTKALKTKVVGKAADVLSLPKRMYFGGKKAEADTDTEILKTARQFKGAPKFEPGKGVTEAGKYQIVSENIKTKRTK